MSNLHDRMLNKQKILCFSCFKIKVSCVSDDVTKQKEHRSKSIKQVAF